MYAIHYKELGDFIRSYYWTSVLPTKELPLNDSNMHILVFDSSSVTVDHSIIPEDQTQDQVIRTYTIYVQGG
ncbi:unnamed protein product [Rotaria sp. Silwood1]|nr:unnamed protein product [Rotaria sp. Silwood1]